MIYKKPYIGMFGLGCFLLIAVYFLGCNRDKPSEPPIPNIEIQLVSPIDEQIISGILIIKANTSDTINVEKVAFYLDHSLYLSDTTPPWQCELDSHIYPDSSIHSIFVVAHSKYFTQSSSDTITFSINNDSIPPSPILDLAVIDSSYSSLTISWTASGDDSIYGNVHSYDVRFGKTPIDSANWDNIESSRIITPIIPPGEQVTCTLSGLDLYTEYFIAVKALDEINNESFLSNIASARTQESPPITDLSIYRTTDSSFILTWTVPGNEYNHGTPVDYDIRYSPEPLTDIIWDNALEFDAEINPQSACNTEFLEITSMSKTDVFYFAIKVADSSGNTSEISNTTAKPVFGLFSSPQYYDHPFDSYADQLALHKKYGLDTIYFVLFAEYDTNDRNIPVSNRHFITLIKGLADYCKIGIHTSFASLKAHEKLDQEFTRLSAVLNKDVNMTRQHFHVLNMPITYRNFVNRDVENDFSMGYAVIPGFRAGICDPFYFYDLDFEMETDMKVWPYAIVDKAIELGYDINRSFRSIIDAVKAHDGTLITLWNNESLTRDRRAKAGLDNYESIIRMALP